MTRSLSFRYGDALWKTSVTKVDRAALYGRRERKAYDAAGGLCTLGSVTQDGRRLFGPNSFEACHLDMDGEWLDHGDLHLVDETGAPLPRRISSFDRIIFLQQTASLETYLTYSVRSVYHLDAPAEMEHTIRAAHGLFTFPFNYTSSHQSDQGFLIAGDAGLFLTAAEPTDLHYVQPDHRDAPTPTEDAEPDFTFL